jgi:nicotinamide-nucleotide amidase
VSDPLAVQVGEALARAGAMLAVAESCTGGLIAQRVTAVAGSSAWFDRGFVVYSNAAKEQMLGVAPALLLAHGAVSVPAVLAMAAGVLARSEAGVALAVSGIAGPGGGSAAKPVGSVCIAWQRAGTPATAQALHFAGGRDAVRLAAADAALRGVLACLGGDRDARLHAPG